MSATNQSVQLDNNGRPIPQLYDPASDSYRAQTTHQDNVSLITHAAASAGTNGADQVNPAFSGVMVVVDITTITGTTPTLTV